MPHLLGIREVIIDFLVANIENHVQEVPAGSRIQTLVSIAQFSSGSKKKSELYTERVFK